MLKKKTREQYEVKKQKSSIMRKGKMFIVSTLWKYSSSIYNASYLLYLFVVSLFFSIIHLFLTIFFISLITLPVRLSSDTSWFSIRFLQRFLCENETDRDSSPCFRNHSKIDTDARLLSCEHTWWAGSCFPSFFFPSPPPLLVVLFSESHLLVELTG